MLDDNSKPFIHVDGNSIKFYFAAAKRLLDPAFGAEHPGITLRAPADQHAVDAGLTDTLDHVAQIPHVAIAENQRARSGGHLDRASDGAPVGFAFVTLLESAAMQRNSGRLFREKGREPVFDDDAIVAETGLDRHWNKPSFQVAGVPASLAFGCLYLLDHLAGKTSIPQRLA